MKRVYLLALAGCCLLAMPNFAASTASPAPTSDNVEQTVKAAKDNWDNMSKKEKRQVRKEMKHKIKAAIKDWKNDVLQSEDKLLLVIIAIILPPLAMFIYEDGLTSRFWLSLLLTLLFYFPGLIYTLIIILGDK